ncbi:transcription factor HES-5-like [Spea bombifrons]|uniref:transcription factor HES-5-like n=1 Tax=Spea bombifrons TaxID=233779 RepID=UPI00234A76EF|nr:transcription factor HES-5-like [Spea bombifrons]
MAPCSNRMEDFDTNIGKEMRKLRKPVIEKMRRDRINSSIEQLRTLLEKKFQKHQLPSKPEKADILEMAVTLLRQQVQRANKAMTPSNQDFRPLMDITQFLPLKKHAEKHVPLISDSNEYHMTKENLCQSTVNQGIGKGPSQGYSTEDLWRPW